MLLFLILDCRVYVFHVYASLVFLYQCQEDFKYVIDKI